MNRYTHRLYGCSPEPLGSYLKALGILRCIAQDDSRVTGRWEADCFVVESDLENNALIEFFLERYSPTPVVNPWSSSSGFGKEGKDGLRIIEDSSIPRLETFRSIIAAARRIGAEYQVNGWPEKLDSKMKERLIAQCRAEFPDAGLLWIDTAVILADDKAVWPPILGTGGNIGRFDLSRNFHEHLVRAIGIVEKKGDDRQAWLEDALFDSTPSKWTSKSASQFNPGASGGTNSGPMGKGEGLVNPWDFVLTVEGTMLFAGAISRRFSTAAKGTATAPFMTYASPGGFSSLADGESTSQALKGEVWTPLWENPTGLAELSRLFSEGRADWGKGHVRSGLDLAKAAGSLGVDRGLTAFARNIFAVRDGQNSIAVQAGRVAVNQRPVLSPMRNLDRWIDKVKRAGNPPPGIRSALWEVEKRAFAVASGTEPKGLLPLLIDVAKLEAEVAKSSGFRNKNLLAPVSGLTDRSWINQLLDCSPDRELRLALVLASGRDVRESGSKSIRSLRMMLCPVQTNNKSGRVEWSSSPASVLGLGYISVVELLARAHARRSIDLMTLKRQAVGSAQEGIGIDTRWRHGLQADLRDVVALASGSIDEVLLTKYLSACMLLDWERVLDRKLVASSDICDDPIPPALAILGPFYGDQPKDIHGQASESWEQRLNSVSLQSESSWPMMLSLGRYEAVVNAGILRLRIAGLEPIATRMERHPPSGSVAAVRLGAALLCRISSSDRVRLLKKSCPETDLTKV